MKRFTLCILSLLLLTGCTGTPNEEIPILLIAAIDGNDGPQLLLFEDKLNSTIRFPLVDKAARDLSAPAVAFDFTDRNNRRDQLFVLTRDGENVISETSKSYIEIFDTLAIDPATPAKFKKTRSIDLSTIPDLPKPFCPTQIQLTRDGRYAVIFSEITVCGLSDDKRRIVIIDISQTTLEKLLLSIIPPRIQGFAEAGIFLDQSNDSLYFVENGVGDVDLLRLDQNSFDDVTSTNKQLPSNLKQQVNKEDVIRGTSFFQINRIGSGFVLLDDNKYTHISDTTQSATVTQITTTARSRQMITDTSGEYKQLFILGENGLTIHFDANKTDSAKTSERASSMTLNYVTDFLYLADQNVIKVFDLFDLDQTITSLQIDSETVPTLTTRPTLLTWIPGVIKEP